MLGSFPWDVQLQDVQHVWCLREPNEIARRCRVRGVISRLITSPPPPPIQSQMHNGRVSSAGRVASGPETDLARCNNHDGSIPGAARDFFEESTFSADSEHRFPAPSSKEGCRKPVLGVCFQCTLRVPLSGTFLQTTPLKGHSLSPRSCPPTRSAPSERFGYR